MMDLNILTINGNSKEAKGFDDFDELLRVEDVRKAMKELRERLNKYNFKDELGHSLELVVDFHLGWLEDCNNIMEKENYNKLFDEEST